MKEKKKPDHVVFDEKDGKYNASLLPYGSNVSAPSIHLEDISNWKKISVNKVNHQIKSKYDKLKDEFDQMMQQFEYNKLVYSATYNFEPVVGEIYHLYKRENDETFLSMIAPHQCNFNHIGSFRLNYDRMWLKVEAEE